MPALRGGRPLKRWTWVGAFGPEAMLCAAIAHVGPVASAWWAVWDRETGVLHERSLRRARADDRDALARARAGRARAGGRGRRAPSRSSRRTAREYAWTRKRGGVRVRGTATLGGRSLKIDARGLVDESAGYHARHTAWRWSAGAGVAAVGRAGGVEPRRGPPRRRRRLGAHGVGGRRAARGRPRRRSTGWTGVGGLRFTAEATRARRDRLLVVSSDYEQPFGTFTGDAARRRAAARGPGA